VAAVALSVNAVTGVFSYTGRAIAEELLARGEEVRSLSRRDPAGDPLRARVDVAPLVFEPQALETALRGASTLFNTYWIRFERGRHTFDEAVARTVMLFRAAERAGVQRIVHLSVTNPERAPHLPYFRGKLRLEEWLAGSGIPHAIVRPTLVFGPEDILVNNIAWILRRFPVFLVPGDGRYEVQPVSVGDVARIAISAEGTVDAAGPERLSFAELVRLVRAAVGSRARVAPAPAAAALALTRLAGAFLRDVVLTRDELDGLMRSLLVGGDVTGRDSFTRWVEQNGRVLGQRYVSELARNFRGQV
jgi:NADH dehydrogenase